MVSDDLRCIGCICAILAWYWTTWSRTIYGPGPLIILKNILSQICSRTIFEINTAPGAYRNLFLEQCWFQIWSWSIFDLEYSSTLLMVQDHKVLMIQDHILSGQNRTKAHTLHTLQDLYLSGVKIWPEKLVYMLWCLFASLTRELTKQNFWLLKTWILKFLKF